MIDHVTVGSLSFLLAVWAFCWRRDSKVAWFLVFLGGVTAAGGWTVAAYSELSDATYSLNVTLLASCAYMFVTCFLAPFVIFIVRRDERSEN